MKDVKLPKATIDAIFNASECATDYVLDFFRYVVIGADLLDFVGWDNVESIGHYPQVSPETSRYMMERAIETDRRNNCRAMPGGTWMNVGFSSLDGEDIPDWTVRLDTDRITFNVGVDHV